jgi:hypothetical protein
MSNSNSSVTTTNRELDKLWNYYRSHDFYVFHELSTAIIGIGALFFAFGQGLASPVIRIVIALIGLGGSVALWFHIYASNMDGKNLNNRLRTIDQGVYQQFNDFPLMEASKELVLLSSV